jgi:DNA-binding NtrC family response regulator
MWEPANLIRRALDSLRTTLAGLYSQIGDQCSAVGRLTVVALMRSDDNDGRLLVELGNRNGWQVVFAHKLCRARSALAEASVPIALCDRELLGSEWRSAIERLSAPPLRACVIVASGAVDTNLWKEVARKGGYEVLSKPLREDEVARAVRLARSYWNSPASTGKFLEESRQTVKRGEL